MPSYFRTVRLLAAASLVLAAACASKSGAPVASQVPNRTANVLTAQEVEASGRADGSAYDAVRRLRPSFLTYRGVSGSSTTAGRVLVSIDGGTLTIAEALRSVPARAIDEVRYLSASDAAQRFGTSANSSPVLVVRQK